MLVLGESGYLPCPVGASIVLSDCRPRRPAFARCCVLMIVLTFANPLRVHLTHDVDLRKCVMSEWRFEITTKHRRDESWHDSEESSGACPSCILDRMTIKFTIGRERPSGSPGDPDIFGAQQYASLLDLPVRID